jgi:hypothetical protein
MTTIRKPSGMRAHDWTPPARMVEIAKERTLDIIGVWCSRFRWVNSSIAHLARLGCSVAARRVRQARKNRRGIRTMSMTAPNLTLYGIESVLLELLTFRESIEQDPDMTPDEQRESLAACDQQIREYVTAEIRKVDRVAHNLREFERRAEIDRAEAKRILDRARQWEARHDRLEALVKDVMLVTGNRKLEGQHNTLRIQDSPASVDCRQPDLVPERLQRVTVTMPFDLWATLMALSLNPQVAEVMIRLMDCKHTDPEPIKSAIAEELKCPACRNLKAKREKCAECGGTGLSKQGVPGCVLVQNSVSLRVE